MIVFQFLRQYLHNYTMQAIIAFVELDRIKSENRGIIPLIIVQFDCFVKKYKDWKAYFVWIA